MKRLYVIVLAIFFAQHAFAQSANRSLSNLKDTTAVNAHLLPVNDNSINIGSTLKSWKNLYLDGAIYLGNVKFISHVSGTGTENTAIGVDVLASATAGYQNTGLGYNALRYNTSGSHNTANGFYALRSNTTGYFNTANGAWALRSNTSGNSNTGNGSSALYNNTIGDNNTATGVVALYHNTTGNTNTANGAGTLYHNTSGSNNTASGYQALYTNTTGYQNTANGTLSLNANTTGYRNTATGSQTLKFNTTGYFNTGNGNAALTSNTTGSSNTASGVYALTANTTGNYNTADGVEALYNNTSGSYNTASGRRTLYSNTTGSLNTALGYNADVSSGSLSNATALGYGAVANASNKVRIGNSSVTSIGGHVNWTSFSDGRYKKNIQENVKGLVFINALRPVTYTTDIRALEAYYQSKRNSNNADKTIQAEQDIAAAVGSRLVYTGFVAQEVEAAAKKLGYDFSGVDKPAAKDGMYGLRYSDFVVPLVKAVQELSMKNDEKDEKINNLQKQLDELREILVSKQSITGGRQLITGDASLAQNVPNPFNNTTSIAYSLPTAYASAKIVITDIKGKQLKQFNVSGAGKGVVHIDASTFASGAYYYSLYADGRLIGSRKMIRNN